VRSSVSYLKSLRDGRTVFVAGTRVDDVTAVPNFQPILSTLCAIEDDGGASWSRATDPAFALTLPTTPRELAERGAASGALAAVSSGFLGRLNDYTLSYLLDLCSLREILSRAQPDAPSRIEAFLDHCRVRQPLVAHAISHPQVDRRRGSRENGALRVSAITPDGVVLDGARMVATLAPLANELLIAPFGLYAADDSDLVLMCVVPLNAQGLSMHVRPLDAAPGDPLAVLDEPDATVRFDHVFVPHARVFLCGDVAGANDLFTHSTPLAYLAALTRAQVRVDFIAAVGHAVLEAIGAAEFPQNKTVLGDAALELLSIRALLQCALDQSAWDPARACWSPSMPYLLAGLLKVESVAKGLTRLISEHAGSGVLMRLDPGVRSEGPEWRALEQIARGPGLSGAAKAALLRLAWSVALGPIGTRQLLYDRYAFGDPFSLRAYLGRRHDWSSGAALLDRALARSGSPLS